MVIVMDMSTGKRSEDEASPRYGDEVMRAGWVDIPRVEPGLQEHPVTRPVEPPADVGGFLARLYLSQE